MPTPFSKQPTVWLGLARSANYHNLYVTTLTKLLRTMAFVAGSSFVGTKVVNQKAVSAKPTSPAIARRSVVMMAEDNKPKPGFNLANETLNGRAAMLGFVIALGTEILNPAHPTIVQQVTSVTSLIGL